MRATRRNRSLRVLDRYLGIPLLSLFAVAPRRREPARDTVRRIGLLKTAAIGDTFLLSGALQDLQRTFPDASLVLITGPDNSAAATMLPIVASEQIIVSPHAPLAAIASVRRAALDLIVDFGSWPRFDAMLAACSGARFRLGFQTPGQARHFAFDRVVEHSSTVHESENYRRLLSAIGVAANTPLSIPVRQALSPAQLPARAFVVFHPWSGGFRHEVKEWPSPRWVELGRRLGYHIVVTAGPGDMERARALVAALSEAGCTASLGAFTLAELPDLFAASRAVVSVNTGVMHLAALIGARTVSLEGPVSVARWGPIGPRVRAVKSSLPGCGYLDLGFEYDGQRHDCMDGVSVDAVHHAIEELLLVPD
jgi:heptosyltransferase-3